MVKPILRKLSGLSRACFTLCKVRTRKVRTPLGSTRVNDPPSRGAEQWNRENVQGNDPKYGNGSLWGFRKKVSRKTYAAGVKTAKLCMEQDQIGKH